MIRLLEKIYKALQVLVYYEKKKKNAPNLGFLAMFPQTQTVMFSDALIYCKFWVSGSTSSEAF